MAVYVHWPYCARICPYCDFNVVRDRNRPEEAARLLSAIISDLNGHAERLGSRQVDSIYFGGGTPSRMSPEAVAETIGAAVRLWPPATDPEITLEANPNDADSARFSAFSNAGINRLSLGVQSLDDDQLRFLGRDHNAFSARRAADQALSTFPSVSLDLIYALPKQTTAQWAAMLADAAKIGAEHLSAYQLTIEPMTAFGRAARRGVIAPVSDDLAAELYDTTQTVLGGLGFDAYEVSNHARGRAARARHNLAYWRGETYVGVGPGAHGRLTVDGRRFATVTPSRIHDYVDAVQREGIGATLDELAPREQAVERLLMGLRTDEGVDLAELTTFELGRERMSELEGFLEISGGRLLATRRARDVLDRVISELAIAY